MPEVRFYKPDDNVKWLVRKFETIKSEHASLQMADNFIPRPDIALVFNFEKLPTIVDPVNLRLKPLILTSIFDKPIQLSIEGRLDTFVVICNATVLSGLLKVNLNAGLNPFIEVSDDRFKLLWQKLLEIKEDSCRIGFFTGEVQKLADAPYQSDHIDNIYNDILENSLRKPLSQMIEKACCSKSSLNRNFLKRSGRSMKNLIRITRVHSIFERMLKRKHFNYQETLSESSYYDQSHFIRDFREITGQTPMNFFKQNSELCRILSGMGKPDKNQVIS